MDTATQRIVELFEALPGLCARDSDLVRRGRFLTCEIKLGIGALPLVVSVKDGSATSVTRGPFLLRPWDFALSADAETWTKLLEPMPAPGFHDLMALSKCGLLKIEGNLQPFMANLQYVKDLISLPRSLAAGALSR